MNLEYKNMYHVLKIEITDHSTNFAKTRAMLIYRNSTHDLYWGYVYDPKIYGTVRQFILTLYNALYKTNGLYFSHDGVICLDNAFFYKEIDPIVHKSIAKPLRQEIIKIYNELGTTPDVNFSLI